MTVYSDFYNHSFGEAFGIQLKDLGILARAVFIIDEKNTVKYVQVVSEVTNEPNYEEVLAALKK